MTPAQDVEYDAASDWEVICNNLVNKKENNRTNTCPRNIQKRFSSTDFSLCVKFNFRRLFHRNNSHSENSLLSRIFNDYNQITQFNLSLSPQK